MEVRITAHSQSHRLRERLAEADVRHGQELRADVRGVRVRLGNPTWLARPTKATGDVYFCTVDAIRVRRVAIDGDGGELPDHTSLEGLQVPAEGTYDLLNVLVRSNGDLRLIVDEASEVEAVTGNRRESYADLVFSG